MQLLENILNLWEIDWFFRLIYSVLTFLGALLLTFLIRKFIRHRLKCKGGENLRLDTLSKLFRSIATYVIWFIAAIQILTVGAGVDITGVLAAAGIVGVAVGFGAQTLVKDIIAGFFLVFENQFSVGESVIIDDFTGTIKELGLRSTRIRAEDGSVMTLPNGSITKVINLSRK